MKKKAISALFDSNKINNSQFIFGGSTGSAGSTTQVDTGETRNGTYDIETQPSNGGCDASNTGFIGTENGEQDNPNTTSGTPSLPEMPGAPALPALP